MLKDTTLLKVRVAAIESITPLVKRFTLRRDDNADLPAFSAGSHIIVQMRSKHGQVFNNAYSLIGNPENRQSYQIAVRLEQPSKGGSAFMHGELAVGDELFIAEPRNLFALEFCAEKHLLIAGGIGITPFLAQRYELCAKNCAYELHYAFRSKEHGAFLHELTACGAPFYAYDSAQGQRLDVKPLLSGLAETTHVYVCGPPSLISDVIETAQSLGIANNRLHKEQFVASSGESGAFTVVLARSARELRVEAGISILQAIESSNAAEVQCLCREGVCGTCETAILEGQAEHLDQYLSDEEKAAGKTLMICVSRARSERLVLDL